MARTPFKMRSGNSTPFKQMGSSPMRDDTPIRKTTYADAYKKRDMEYYGDMSAEEYTKEAKRQSQSKKDTGKWDVPSKPITKAKVVVKNKPNNTKVNDEVGNTEVVMTPGVDKTGTPPTNKEVKTKRRVDNIAATAAVRTARAKYGRGSDEVKAAKAAREVLKPGTVASRLLGGKGSKSKAKKDAKNKVKKAKLAEKTAYYNKRREELKTEKK
tara:strand:+ start:142 stop:780 length:639 start_codon:yes stop_codon:yes gene_type:complete